MSTFSGILNEYPSICIDNFNPIVSVYFLSHVHWDHYDGVEYFKPLQGTKIYVSEITKNLLLGFYSKFKLTFPHLIALQFGKQHEIDVGLINKLGQISTKCEKIKVTLIPVNHCLGSAMFLIDGDNGKVLYTGDIRINVGETAALRDEYGLHNLDSVYLDTTFIGVKSLPSTERSFERMFQLIENHLNTHPDNIVYVDYHTRFNIEYLFSMTYNILNIKTHVAYNYFQSLGQLHSDFHSFYDPSNIRSRVHVSCLVDQDPNTHTCKSFLNRAEVNGRLLTIIPTTMWWTYRKYLLFKGIMDIEESPNHIRVIYSSHSSAEELHDFILTLRPQQVFDCVYQPKNNWIVRQFNPPILPGPRKVETSHRNGNELYDLQENSEYKSCEMPLVADEDDIEEMVKDVNFDDNEDWR